MYEKIKSFFGKYWFFLVAGLALVSLVYLGVRSIKRNADILVKNNKIVITKSKAK